MNPNEIDLSMESFTIEEANIDAMLAVVLARNMKMMKFINRIYDTDKDHYAAIAKKNSRFRSRIITDTRITVKLNAIKALAIITAAKDDEKLREALHTQMERVYKTEAQTISKFKDVDKVPLEMMSTRHIKSLQKGDTSDEVMNELISIYFYFCRYEGKKIEPRDQNELDMYKDAFGHEIAAMLPMKEYFRQLYQRSNFNKEREEFSHLLPKLTGFSKTLSEFFYYINTENIKLLGLFQTWWDVAALDNIPISMYEREEISKSEMDDIFDIILLHMVKEKMPANHIMIAILGSMILRSFARIYHEAVDTIEQYAGVIETSEKDKKLVEDAKKLHQKVEAQETLITGKQEKLNAQQLEIDRLRKSLKEKDIELAQLQEQNQLLRKFIQEEGQEEKPEKETVSVRDALEAKVVVFGGTDAWQSAVKERAANYVCVDTKNDAFDTNIVNKADVVVFKIDYLSHKQFYKVIDKIRKMKLPVVYCSNNIDLMLKKIAKELAKKGKRG